MQLFHLCSRKYSLSAVITFNKHFQLSVINDQRLCNAKTDCYVPLSGVLITKHGIVQMGEEAQKGETKATMVQSITENTSRVVV